MKPIISSIPQEHYIAFLGILQFQETVKQCIADQQQFLRLKNTLANLQALCLPDEESPGCHVKRLLERCLHPRTIPPRSVALMQCTVFAEHMVFSMPVTHAQVFWFLSAITYAWCLLAELGLFLRGGVTTGWLTHTPAVVFGPGLTSASALASAQANFPRVGIDAALVARWAPPERSLLRQDEDGVYYIDIFHLPMFLQRRTRIHQHIYRGLLETQRDARDRYHWLATHVELTAIARQP